MACFGCERIVTGIGGAAPVAVGDSPGGIFSKEKQGVGMLIQAKAPEYGGARAYCSMIVEQCAALAGALCGMSDAVTRGLDAVRKCFAMTTQFPGPWFEGVDVLMGRWALGLIDRRVVWRVMADSMRFEMGGVAVLSTVCCAAEETSDV